MGNKNVPELRFPGFNEEWNESKISNYIKSLNAGVSVNSEDSLCQKDEKGILKTSCLNGGLFDPYKHKTILKEEESRAKVNPKKNRIIVSRMNTPALVGNLAYIDKDYFNLFLPDRLWQLEPKNSISMQWLSYLLNTHKYKYSLKSKATGTSGSMKNITKGDLLSIRFYHTDETEQNKIASFLSSVDSKIGLLTKKKGLMEQYKKGIMQKIFSQAIRFKDDNGNDYPDWEEKKLGVITTLLKDGTHGTHIDTPGSNYKLLSAKNIKNGSVVYDNTDREISKSDYESIYSKYKLIDGDLLLSVVGTIGRSAIFSGLKHIAFQRSVAFFRFDCNYNSVYIYQLFNSFKFQKELLKRQVVSAQPGIYLNDLSKIMISSPSLQEQQKIATFLSSIDNKVGLIDKELDSVRMFKKGLLQKMFV